MARAKRKGRPSARGGSDAMRRGYARGAERDEAIRATLEPLAPDEYPAALKIAIAVAILLALSNLVAFVLGADVPGSSSRGFGLVWIVLMLLAAWGMWRHRYWAVLGFATVMALIAVVFTLYLLVASNVLAVVLCVAAAGSAGWLFWKLIRVMARLQAPHRVS